MLARGQLRRFTVLSLRVVTGRMASIVADLAQSVRRQEDSLKRLHRATGRDVGALSDADKICLQLQLDAQEVVQRWDTLGAGEGEVEDVAELRQLQQAARS